MREFESGATRDNADDKPDYFGFESALARKRYGQYMLRHQVQADGVLRSSDNWKKGMPPEETVRSLVRHVEDIKLWYEGYGEEMVARCDLEEALCASWFNIQSMLTEVIKERVRRERQYELDAKKGGYILND